MKDETYLKGPALYALARKKAKDLGVECNNMKLMELITCVQAKEGHTPCFRQKKICAELKCCWQVSCRAEMKQER